MRKSAREKKIGKGAEGEASTQCSTRRPGRSTSGLRSSKKTNTHRGKQERQERAVGGNFLETSVCSRGKKKMEKQMIEEAEAGRTIVVPKPEKKNFGGYLGKETTS